MKKYKSGWEKEKSRREAEDKLKNVVAKSKKVTDFFHISEPKSNIVETTSSNATALVHLRVTVLQSQSQIQKLFHRNQIYKPSHLMLLRIKRIEKKKLFNTTWMLDSGE